MKTPYSKRGKVKPDVFTYEITFKVRGRLFYALRDIGIQSGNLVGLFAFLQHQVARFEGVFQTSRNNSTSYYPDPMADFQWHWENSRDDQFLDILEWIFEYPELGQKTSLLGQFNDIFKSEGVGYELAGFSEEHETGTDANGRQWTSVRTTSFPLITKKTNEVMHSTVSIPAIQLLSHPRWRDANEEMLKAHTHLRDGNFRESINMAGSSLESVLKTICDLKKWPHRPDKDTLNPLLQAAHKGNLFPSPYIEIIQKSSGEMRNKWSHGQAGTTYGPATYEIAENMIQVTSSHIIFLVTAAKLK